MGQQILIVDDDEMQRSMLQTLLRRKLEVESVTAANGREALDWLRDDDGKNIRLVVLDLNMPVMDGMEALAIIRQKYPALPVIMLTGSRDIEKATGAMKLGATDFVTKPYEAERMIVTVRNALKIGVLSKEVKRLSESKSGHFTFDHLIGHEDGLKDVVFLSRKAAASEIPVLISGETGVGKEVFSKAMHGESSRAGKPFIAVNCGAIPSQLVESTLFGHEKGSFTGATEKTSGKFREADGGTIFLDEVGELPLEAQVKLLRVLQQREVEPVGAGKPSLSIFVLSLQPTVI
ncbi:MAG: sigma-54 dependent transcriptional regulator [Alphaproteobacteria bacterium]|nr:sigma-54 dependent transcriptional regulator [Alphaproteobacteria bacterium]